MPLYATAEEGPPTLAPGTYEIRCMDIKEDEIEGGRNPHIWRFFFETTAVLDGNGDPIALDGIASRKLTPKSKAWAWCEAFGLKPEIGKRVDLEEIIGHVALAKIINKPGADGTGAFARIDSIMPLPTSGASQPVKDDLSEWWANVLGDGFKRDVVIAKSQEMFDNREPKLLTTGERAQLVKALT